MLLWSLGALERVRAVTSIVVAAPSSAIGAFEALRGDAGISKWEAVIPGGETRSASVRALLSGVRTPRVLVHDAARPCIDPGWIEGIIAELGDAPAGVPALPVRDTLKRARDGVVTSTLSRDDLHQVQTPQLFDTEVLRRAHAVADTAPAPTDDAALVEALGLPVRLLRGDPWNLKVTFSYDLAVAETYLRQRPHEPETPR
jgi:2-C-methyl-D-erythritol 4-phosphate cytidylyltransferase